MDSKSVGIFRNRCLYHKLLAKPFFTKPNQTDPKFTPSIKNDSIATLRPNQLEFWKSVAYITSYDQKRGLPNQTKPAGHVWWVVYGGNKS